MLLIRPFKATRPAAEYAQQVFAPPYDVLNREEACQYAKNKPLSFLHISKPEIDLPAEIDCFDAQVYATGKENLAKLLADNIFQQEEKPVYYLYQLIMGEHQQTGLVGLTPLAAYSAGKICKHEQTRSNKVNDRVKNMQALDCQASPVMLACEDNVALEKVFADRKQQQQPDIFVTAENGVEHRLWTIADENSIEQINQIFATMDKLYIADGHHRTEAAAKAGHDFLSVIFPQSQLQILSYNRIVKDLNGLSKESFLQQLGDHWQVEPIQQGFTPQQAEQVAMYLDGQWYQLNLQKTVTAKDPISHLPVTILAKNLLEPMLNIQDQSKDNRIDFIGGIRGLSELEKHVNSGNVQLAFALAPTAMSDLIKVSDAEAIMPPKSTWFEPKLADGLFICLADAS